MANDISSRIKGMFLIIDRRNDRGLKHWIGELEKREIPAVILVDEFTLYNNCSLIK